MTNNSYDLHDRVIATSLAVLNQIGTFLRLWFTTQISEEIGKYLWDVYCPTFLVTRKGESDKGNTVAEGFTAVQIEGAVEQCGI